MMLSNDSNQFSLGDLPLSKVLLGMRIMWFALLTGQVAFLLILALLILPHPRPGLQPQPMLAWVSFAFFAAMVPAAFVVRGIIFRRRQVEGGLPATAYNTGNVIFWAACEGASFLGLVVAFINGTLWPTIIVVAAAMGLQALTIPVASRLAPPGATSDGI